MITQSIHYQQLFTRCSCQKMTVSLSKKYTEKKKKQKTKKKRYMYSQCKITHKEVIICIVYFILKCKNVSKALKMNITIKAGKLMSTDQFDSRRGQNLKTQFRNALLRPEVCSNDYQCAQFISWTFIRHHWVTKRSINCFKCISR